MVQIVIYLFSLNYMVH